MLAISVIKLNFSLCLSIYVLPPFSPLPLYHRFSAPQPRYKLEFIKPNNWQLVIEAAEEGDQGDYECQVSSHPPKIRTVFLSVYGESHETFPLFVYVVNDVYSNVFFLPVPYLVNTMKCFFSLCLVNGMSGNVQ